MREGRPIRLLPRRDSHIALVLALVLLAGLPAAAWGQEASTGRAPGTVVGQVLDDATGQPVDGMLVRLDGPERRTVVSDASGRFRVAGIAPGVYEMQVSHIAYGESARLVNVPSDGVVSIEVRVVPRAIALDSIVVTARIQNFLMVRGGYYERKRRSVGGTFMDGDDLPPGGWVSTMLHQAPFVEIRSGRSAFDRVITIRHGGRNCIPDLFIDGMPILLFDGQVDDYLFPSDIEAIEVYHGLETPGEFILHPRERPCGAIVIWRKRP